MEARSWYQHYDQGVPHTIDYPSIVVHQFLNDTAAKYPDNTALIFFDKQLTYRQLNALVDKFAAGLQQHGLKKGDRVALYMANCPQFVIAYYAILRAGGIVVPSNPLYVAREFEHQANDSGAKIAICLSLLYPRVKEARPSTGLEHVIVTNIKEYFPGFLKLLFTLAKEKKDGHRVDISNDPDTYWFQDVLNGAPDRPAPMEIAPEDTAVLMYTGGTTGVPKGAQLTQRNVVANAVQTAAWMVDGVEGQEVSLTALPLTHSYAMTVCMNQSICRGYAQILIPNPREFAQLLGAINKHRPTMFPGVPSLYAAINNHPDVLAGKYDVKSIKVCISGAAGLPPEVQEEFQRITGGKLVEGYGLSEATPVTHSNPIRSGGRIGTIGLPFPDTDCKIVDTDTETETMGPGEPGVLCISGPQVMKGYWGMPTETANVLRQDETGKVWLHTGDVAQMSQDGYFRIVDRKKDMILGAGGYNVYPREIEDVLYEHPKVMEAAAIGVPIGGSDQRAKVFIVLRPGETATEEEIIEFCRERLARYKVPKYVEFREDLPKTMVGKILRRELMETEKTQEAT
ncbi:MAG: long-chain fatty acid--CoA ligase [Anaerolineales bacterium]|nr:MAG: long-chain fatty acid--CoA ligase [Anaerolineales bacterium]